MYNAVWEYTKQLKVADLRNIKRCFDILGLQLSAITRILLQVTAKSKCAKCCVPISFNFSRDVKKVIECLVSFHYFKHEIPSQCTHWLCLCTDQYPCFVQQQRHKVLATELKNKMICHLCTTNICSAPKTKNSQRTENLIVFAQRYRKVQL